MHPFARGIKNQFELHANPVHAASMAKYMKNHFPFYGLKRPERNLLQKKYLDGVGGLSSEDLEPILKDLWTIEQRECQYFAMDLIKKNIRKQSANFIRTLEFLITEKSWWDTVDLLATLSGTLMFKHRELNPKIPDRWMKSNNLWLQRSAILFQLKYGDQTDWPLLQKYILAVSQSKEFFLQKASGWALRQYSKHYPERVRSFIDSSGLSKLTVREGLKVINRN